MSRVPCPHPDRCGVESHVAGSAAHRACGVAPTVAAELPGVEQVAVVPPNAETVRDINEALDVLDEDGEGNPAEYLYTLGYRHETLDNQYEVIEALADVVVDQQAGLFAGSGRRPSFPDALREAGFEKDSEAAETAERRIAELDSQMFEDGFYGDDRLGEPARVDRFAARMVERGDIERDDIPYFRVAAARMYARSQKALRKQNVERARRHGERVTAIKSSTDENAPLRSGMTVAVDSGDGIRIVKLDSAAGGILSGYSDDYLEPTYFENLKPENVLRA